jgi:NitT/TauT family transport system substrate-binding protein
MPLYLNSRNPAVKTVKDFTDTDRIALPGVKSSIQAVTLQMAAEQAFGPGNFAKLDSLTVTRSHPDAQAALLGNTEINAHFSSPPFQYQQLRRSDIHTVLNSYDVLGGPATFNLVWTTQKFVNENPKVYAAFVKALEESIASINANKRSAAEAYLRMSKDKDSVDDILAMLNDPKIVFTLTPQNMMKYVDFMAKVGTIKVKPDSWKDMFFPNAQTLAGS